MKLVLGVAPTRRDYFTNETVLCNRDHINGVAAKLAEQYGFDVIGIEGLSEDGTLSSVSTAEKAAERFLQRGVNALFIPHVNFGQEEAVLRLVSRLRLPTLIWGGRDEAPDGFTWRTTDTQCGLFATGKALYRAGLPFTYIENCITADAAFTEGFERFISAALIVNSVKNLRIAQISVRPQPFLSVMINESELFERFGIEVAPVPVTTIISSARKLARSKDADDVIAGYRAAGVDLSRIEDEPLHNMAGLELAIRNFAAENGCTAAASECWNVYGEALGIRPCAVFGNLADKGLPVACENDIHGAISLIIAQAANRFTEPVFLADLTQRHPTNDNAELLWHCGPFPKSLRRQGGHAFVNDYMGQWEMRPGELTLLRFDGCRGQYNLFAGLSKAVDGPLTNGNYVWVEVDDWARWERRIVTGPYIHHTACVYGDHVKSIEDACAYLPALAFERP